MIAPLLPNLGTLVVLALVVLAAGLAFRSLRHARGCSCGCGGCEKDCPHRFRNHSLPH